MPKLSNPLAAVLFLAVTVLGSWFVLRHGMSARQQKAQAEAAAVYEPPLEAPMAQSALPGGLVFGVEPRHIRWRRFVGAEQASPFLCFWVDFEAGDYGVLQGSWKEGRRRGGIFVDGFLPGWFLEGLCQEGFLCPGQEEVVALKPSELGLKPRGRQLFYALARLNGLFGCIEEGEEEGEEG